MVLAAEPLGGGGRAEEEEEHPLRQRVPVAHQAHVAHVPHVAAEEADHVGAAEEARHREHADQVRAQRRRAEADGAARLLEAEEREAVDDEVGGRVTAGERHEHALERPPQRVVVGGVAVGAVGVVGVGAVVGRRAVVVVVVEREVGRLVVAPPRGGGGGAPRPARPLLERARHLEVGRRVRARQCRRPASRSRRGASAPRTPRRRCASARSSSVGSSIRKPYILDELRASGRIAGRPRLEDARRSGSLGLRSQRVLHALHTTSACVAVVVVVVVVAAAAAAAAVSRAQLVALARWTSSRSSPAARTRRTR